MRTKIDQVEKDSIIALYDNGKTPTEIEELSGRTRASIYKILKDNGRELRGNDYSKIKKFTDEQELKIIDDVLHHDKSIADIQTETLVDQQTIRSIFKRRDIAIPKRKTLTKDEQEKEFIQQQILKLYKENHSFKEIQKKLDISFASFVRIIKGIIVNKISLYDILIEYIDTEYVNGTSAKIIADSVGCNLQSVLNIVSKNGGATRRAGPKAELKRMNNDGYVELLLNHGQDFYNEMARKDGRCFEHRYVMAKSLGRALEPNETVHHIDGNRQNNDISNLQLRKSNHGPGQKYACGDCGSHNIVSNKV